MSEEKIKNNPGSSNDFTPTFIDYGPLPDVKVSARLGNISTHKFSKLIYFLHTRYIVDKFKHRFQISSLLIWSSEVN